jgi:hypothetical protein
MDKGKIGRWDLLNKQCGSIATLSISLQDPEFITAYSVMFFISMLGQSALCETVHMFLEPQG